MTKIKHRGTYIQKILPPLPFLKTYVGACYGTRYVIRRRESKYAAYMYRKYTKILLNPCNI